MKKLTVRVPAEVKTELRALKVALPRPLRKASQDDIVGALIHAATTAAVVTALDSYYEALDGWDTANDDDD